NLPTKVQNTITSCSNTDIDKVVSKPLALSIITDIAFSFVAYICCLNSYPCHLYFGIIIFIFFSWLTDIIRRQGISKGVWFKYEVVQLCDLTICLDKLPVSILKMKNTLHEVELEIEIKFSPMLEFYVFCGGELLGKAVAIYVK